VEQQPEMLGKTAGVLLEDKRWHPTHSLCPPHTIAFEEDLGSKEQQLVSSQGEQANNCGIFNLGKDMVKWYQNFFGSSLISGRYIAKKNLRPSS
jgi:hypothetical protein